MLIFYSLSLSTTGIKDPGGLEPDEALPISPVILGVVVALGSCILTCLCILLIAGVVYRVRQNKKRKGKSSNMMYHDTHNSLEFERGGGGGEVLPLLGKGRENILGPIARS